jgi:hypothetical protein
MISVFATLLLAASSAAAAPTSVPLTGDRGPAWVQQRVRAWQPTARERRWEQIGWAKDLRGAQRLAREHGRPVFLFTHDGRLDVGRC